MDKQLVESTIRFIKKYTTFIFLLLIVLICSYIIKKIYDLSYGITFFIFLFLYGYMYTLLNKYD